MLDLGGELGTHEPLLSAAIILHFFGWLAISFTIVSFDAFTFQLITNPTSRSILSILSLLPIGANVIAYAVDAEASPEQISFAVLISTILSPIFLTIFF